MLLLLLMLFTRIDAHLFPSVRFQDWSEAASRLGNGASELDCVEHFLAMLCGESEHFLAEELGLA